ncbi:MAG: universal stress protein [Burkholderiales bacterium]
MIKVLIAVDGSAPSNRAIEAVAQLAELAGPVNVVLVHVRERVSLVAGLSSATRGQLEQAHQREQDKLIAAALDHARGCGLTIGTTRRAEGSAAPEIVAAAAECGADRIVLGTRGMGAIGSLFLGSIAQRVVQLADVPVLLVK